MICEGCGCHAELRTVRGPGGILILLCPECRKRFEAL